MSNLEQNKAIANDPREEIDADLAVGMVYSGFHVFIDKSNEQLTYDMVFGRKRFDFENNTSFTAPMMEVAQYNATEALCEKFDSLNDDVRADLGMSLEEYADELFDNYESEFMWKDGLSEWENIRVSILSGETEYLRYFLNDVSVHYSSRTADLLEDLHEYETNYLEKNIGKQEPLITVSGQSGTNNSFDVTSVGFDTGKKYTVAEFNQALKAANERWQENWDGISYPSNIVIVTVENLHSSPCSYRINLTDDHNSIQDIVEMLPTPMLASLSTDKAIEMLNNAESVPGREEITISADLDKFYVNRENNEIQWVYYNPDSSAGGQLVYNYFSFDKLREAFSQNENAPLDVIAEDCQQLLRLHERR